MGNCFNRSSTDDVSLLRSADNVESTSRGAAIPEGTLQRGPSSYSEIVIAQMLPVYEPGRNLSTPALSETDQVKIAKRIALIQHLPTGFHDGSKKSRECVICMIEFQVSDPVRYLPCLHIYHTNCIDDWLMRSLTCPTCMEPVDAALLNSYYTNN